MRSIGFRRHPDICCHGVETKNDKREHQIWLLVAPVQLPAKIHETLLIGHCLVEGRFIQDGY